MTPDRSPIIGLDARAGAVRELRLGNWRFQGDAGIGHVFAHTIATGAPHPINAPFALDRFRSGALIDEAAAAAVAH